MHIADRLRQRHGFDAESMRKMPGSALLVFVIVWLFVSSSLNFVEWFTKPRGPVLRYQSHVPVSGTGIPQMVNDSQGRHYVFSPGSPIFLYSAWEKLRSCQTLYIRRWVVDVDTGEKIPVPDSKGQQTKGGQWGEVLRAWFLDGLPAGEYEFNIKVRIYCNENEPDQVPLAKVRVLVR